jgi:hypothetical protein
LRLFAALRAPWEDRKHALRKEKTMPRRDSLQAKIEKRIAERSDDVFLTREFADLGGERQVLRALRKEVEAGGLIRLGYGVYGRTFKSQLSGKPVLYNKGGFTGAARDALDKLGVKWEPSDAERAYNEGRTTQIPMKPKLRVEGRFSRKLRDGAMELILER